MVVNASLRQLVNDAYDLFNHGRHREALDLLQSSAKDLAQLDIRNATKVQHNQALLQFLLDSSTTATASGNSTNLESQAPQVPRRLLEELDKLRKRIEERLSQQRTDSTNGGSEHGHDVSANSNAATSASATANPMEEVDAHIVQFNQAVVNAQLRQFGSAIVLLENMFQHVDMSDEAVSLRVCYLLLELHCNVRATDKIASVLHHLEKTFPERCKDTNDLVPLPWSKLTISRGGGDRDNDDATNDDTQQNGSSANVDLTATVPYMYWYYRSRLTLLRGEAAQQDQQDQQTPLQSTVTIPTSMPLTMHAQLFAQLRQPQRAIRALNQLFSSSTSTEPIAPPNFITAATQRQQQQQLRIILYYNNLGCVHYQMRKYAAAAFYYSKALQENDNLFVNSGTNLDSFARNRRPQILYNLGVQLFLSNNAETAFRCFQESSLHFFRDPKLWLRMAECCVMHNIQQISEQRRSSLQPNMLFQDIIAKSSQQRRIVLPTASPLSPKDVDDKSASSSSSSTSDASEQSALYSSISLEMGLRCVRNVIALLNSNHSNDLISGVTNELQVRIAANVNGAYIALALNNPTVALAYAKDLLVLESLSDRWRHIGSLYAAEALAMLSKPSEAAEYLNPIRTGMTEQAKATTFMAHSFQAMPSTVDLKHVLFLNLAVTHILKDELPLALQCIQQAIAIQSSASAISCMIYLQLRLGNVNAALHILKTQSLTTAAAAANVAD